MYVLENGIEMSITEILWYVQFGKICHILLEKKPREVQVHVYVANALIYTYVYNTHVNICIIMTNT